MGTACGQPCNPTCTLARTASRLCEPRGGTVQAVQQRPQGEAAVPSGAVEAPPSQRPECHAALGNRYDHGTAHSTSNSNSEISRAARAAILAVLTWYVFLLLLHRLPDVVRRDLWALPWMFMLWFWHLRPASAWCGNALVNLDSSTDLAAAPKSPVTGADRRTAAVAEEHEFASESTVPAYLEALTRRLEAERPPEDREQLLAAGWCDCSRPTAKVYLKAQPQCAGESYPRVSVSIQCETQDQVQSLPLIAADHDKICGGALAIYYSILHWPLWFPFCDSCQLLKQITPLRSIWLQRFKIMGITAEQIVFIALEDRLDTVGCIEIVMRSPPLGMEGRRWLGITVPEKTARFRVQMVSFRLAGYPTSGEHSRVEFQCELFDISRTGVTWVEVMFWQTISTRIAPLMAKVQSQFAGSELDEHYNSLACQGAEIRNALLGIHKHMRHVLGDQAGVT